MKLIATIMLFSMAALAGTYPSQDSPLRTVHGTVVDAKGKVVAASVVYLHNEQTYAVKTYVTDHHGHYRFSGIRFYTDYRIYAEHNGLVSAVRKISAHSTNKLIKLDLKVDKKRSASKPFVNTDPLTALASEPNDRSSKRDRLQAPTAGVSST
jgi:Carboxypeptidase regulatory-like domain